MEKYLFSELCLAINTEQRNTKIWWNFYFSFSNKIIKRWILRPEVEPTAYWTCDTGSRSNVPYIHEVLILLDMTDRKKSAFDPAKFKTRNSEPKGVTIPLNSRPLYDRSSTIQHSLFPSQLDIGRKAIM